MTGSYGLGPLPPPLMTRPWPCLVALLPAALASGAGPSVRDVGIGFGAELPAPSGLGTGAPCVALPPDGAWGVAGAALPGVLAGSPEPLAGSA
eukprot:10245776-Heterocapsa_arctica.AAC.1